MRSPFENAPFTDGPAPARNYAEEVVDDVSQGTLDPSPIFTRTVDTGDVPEGYRAMDGREAVKATVRLDEQGLVTSLPADASREGS